MLYLCHGQARVQDLPGEQLPHEDGEAVGVDRARQLALLEQLGRHVGDGAICLRRDVRSVGIQQPGHAKVGELAGEAPGVCGRGLEQHVGTLRPQPSVGNHGQHHGTDGVGMTRAVDKGAWGLVCGHAQGAEQGLALRSPCSTPTECR